jgi:hypothetical protein
MTIPVLKPKPKSDPYIQHLERSITGVIDDLKLEDLQKKFLHDRWLKELLWFEKKSVYNQKRHYLLRIVTIVGGVIVPALVSLGVKEANTAHVIAWSTFCVSLVVAISASLDSFFGYGERWRTFRRTSESLKAHGWQFFQLVGHYGAHPDHSDAFPRFAAQVESLFQQDVESFVTRGAQGHATPNPSGAQAVPTGV